MSCTRRLWIGVAALAAWSAHGALADAATVYGEAKKLGDGFAQVYAELDGAGAPQVIGVSFDPGLLAGLPAMPNTWSRCFDKNGNGRDRCAWRMQRRLRAPLHAAARAGAARQHAVQMGQRQLQPDGPPAARAAGVGGAALRLPLLHHGPEAVAQIRPGTVSPS